MERAAKKVLIELAEHSPQKRIIAHNEINAWNETHEKKQRFRSTPARSNQPTRKVCTANPIEQLKILKMKLLSSPTPVKEPPATTRLPTNPPTMQLFKCESSQVRLPQLKSFREMNLDNKQNIPPGCNTQPLYKSKSVRIRKKELCKINLLPCRYNNSSAAIERNIRKQLAQFERNRTRRHLAVQDAVDLRSSFTDRLRKLL